MSETVPTRSAPRPSAAISSRPWSVSAPAVKRQRRLDVLGAERCDGDRLAIVRPVAPDEAHADRRGAGLPGEPDPADVLLRSRTSPSSPWTMPPRRGDLGAVLADERLGGVHRDRIGRAERFPGRLLVADGREELAVFEHFGPNPAVDAAAQVLDELAVDVLRDRRSDVRRVDFDGGPLLGPGGAAEGPDAPGPRIVPITKSSSSKCVSSSILHAMRKVPTPCPPLYPPQRGDASVPPVRCMAWQRHNLALPPIRLAAIMARGGNRFAADCRARPHVAGPDGCLLDLVPNFALGDLAWFAGWVVVAVVLLGHVLRRLSAIRPVAVSERWAITFVFGVLATSLLYYVLAAAGLQRFHPPLMVLLAAAAGLVVVGDVRGTISRKRRRRAAGHSRRRRTTTWISIALGH